jgi:hypothetical protein
MQGWNEVETLCDCVLHGGFHDLESCTGSRDETTKENWELPRGTLKKACLRNTQSLPCRADYQVTFTLKDISGC